MYTHKEIEKITAQSIANINFSKEPAALYAPLRYMISIGGKRIRPRLALTTFSLFSNNLDSSILGPASALEIFHSFTLIHDDIMDKADTRRGQMTVHKKWGENCAILSGDVMSIISYQYLAKYRGANLAEVLNLFSTTAAEVCEGQQYDMDFENEPIITMDEYKHMIGLKTAVLIACAAKMGALIAEAPAQICDALYKYGYELGIAFQITDDYLDTFGDESVFGKKIGGDIVNNKKNWLLVEALHRTNSVGEQSRRLAELMAMGEDRSGEKIAGMQQIYVELGIKEDAALAIKEHHFRALNTIDNIGLSEEQVAVLNEFAEQLVYRES